MENKKSELDKIEVGKKIKEIRLSRGETAEVFGKHFDPPANRGLVSGWENGRYLPSPERLKVIAEVGNISVDELLKGRSIDNDDFDYAKDIYDSYFYERFNRYNIYEDEINKILERAILNARETVKNIKNVNTDGEQHSIYRAMIFANIESGIENILSEKVSDNYTLLNYLKVKINNLESESEIQKSEMLNDGTKIVWSKQDGYSIEALEMIGKLFEDISYEFTDLQEEYRDKHPKKHLKLFHFDLIGSQDLKYENLNDFINTIFNIMILDAKQPSEEHEDINPNEIKVDARDFEIAKEIIENSRDEIEEYYYKYLDNK